MCRYSAILRRHAFFEGEEVERLRLSAVEAPGRGISLVANSAFSYNSVYPHLDRMVLAIINQRNKIVRLHHSINLHPHRAILLCFSRCDLRHSKVIDRLAITVMLFEYFPISR